MCSLFNIPTDVPENRIMSKRDDLIAQNFNAVLKIVREHQSGNLNRKVADEVGVSYWIARTLVAHAQSVDNAGTSAPLDSQDPLFRTQLLRAIKRATTEIQLAKKLKVSREDLKAALDDLEGSGYILQRRGNSIQLGNSVPTSENRIVLADHLHTDPVSFGVVADMHLGNKAARLDVLNAAYDTFLERGIKVVLCPGNYVDGECRFNKHELVAHGIADQCQFAIDNWPQRDGIKTYFVDGDDHEGWWQQREGIEFGHYLQMEAERQGREDLVYMGYLEADFELKTPGGSAIVKVIHAGGGTAYALSYSVQKLVEAFQGGEKPAVVIVGHYHKMEYCFPRNVHCIQAGCVEDQTKFMRKKKLEAHVGFVIVTLQQDAAGSITRCTPEFFPFYDRGYYLKRNDLVSRLKGE